MPAVVIVGAQWGDEGKGKATDLISDRIDYVVKFNGGNNAGHTVVIGDEKYALHLLPSGILTAGVTPVISNGVVIDPEVLMEELDGLTARGIDVSRLVVSSHAHIITGTTAPWTGLPSASWANDRLVRRAAGLGRPMRTKSTASESGSKIFLTRGFCGKKLRAPWRQRTTSW
jgi:adenylosuccinate synthase